MFEYHHIYTFYASSGIANQIFECRILRRYDSIDLPDWIKKKDDSGEPLDPIVFVEPIELQSPKGESMTIDWARGNNVYEPMLGSKFDFTLINVSGYDFLDFFDGDFKEFRVDVINIVPNDSELVKRWSITPDNRQHDHYAFKYVDINKEGYIGQLYWRGFIHPVNSKEPILAPPFNVKFTAVDGLAELGERTMPFHTHPLYRKTERQLLLIDVIQYALEQTKVNLDLAVNSGIIYVDDIDESTKYDALVNSYVSVDAFGNRKLIDVIKGILRGFNCRLIQSNGYWYIYNVSLQNSYHNPKPQNYVNGIIWSVYYIENGKYTKGGAGIDNDQIIRRSINSNRSDLIPIESTLSQTIQQPYKLIECKPEGLHAINMMRNPSFDIFTTIQGPPTYDTPAETNSWTLYDEQVILGQRTQNEPLYTPYTIDPLKLASAKDYAYLQSRALESNRLVARLNSVADIWAVGTTYNEIVGNRNLIVSITAYAWFTDRAIERDKIGNQIEYDRKEIFGNISIPFSVAMVGVDDRLKVYDFEQNVFLSVDETDNINRKSRFKNAYSRIASIKNKIKGNPNQSQYVSRLDIQGGLLKTNTFEFQSTEVELNLTGSRGVGTTGRNSSGITIITNTLKVILWYPQGDANVIKFKNDPANGYPNDNNIIGKTIALIDSVNVSAKIPTDVLNPTFTRLQIPFRRKESYGPNIVHESDIGVAQKIYNIQKKNLIRLFRENTFKRVSELDDEGNPIEVLKYRDTDDSLEQIVTQLKLNDFRRRGQIFEGDIASNHNGYPLFPIQMTDVDFKEWKSGRSPRNQGNPEATIFWGGRYNLSTGIFSISTFTPNQFTDIVPENRADIDTTDFDDDGQLLPGYYTNRSTKRESVFSPRVIDAGEAPEPELPQASWFRYKPIHESKISSRGKAIYTPIEGNKALTNGRMALSGHLYVGDKRLTVNYSSHPGGNVEIDIPRFIVWDATNNRIDNTGGIGQQHKVFASLRCRVEISNMFLDATTEKLTIECLEYEVKVNPNVIDFNEDQVCNYVTDILNGFDPITKETLDFNSFTGNTDIDLRFSNNERILQQFNRFYLLLYALPILPDDRVLGDPSLIAQSPLFLTNDGTNGDQTDLVVCIPVNTDPQPPVDPTDVSITYSPDIVVASGSGNEIVGTTKVTIRGLTNLNRLKFVADDANFRTVFNTTDQNLSISILRTFFPTDKLELATYVHVYIDNTKQTNPLIARPLRVRFRIIRLVLEFEKTTLGIGSLRVDSGFEDIGITHLQGLLLSELSVRIENLVGISASVLSEGNTNLLRVVWDSPIVPTSITSQTGKIHVDGATTIEGRPFSISKSIDVNYIISG